VASTCLHGYAPDQCLICQTLQGPADARTRRTAPPPPEGSAGGRVPARRRPADAASPAPQPLRHTPARSLGVRAGGLALLVVVIVLAFGWLAGVAYALVHLIEVAAAAIIAGWVGYRIGVHRGRRSHPGP